MMRTQIGRLTAWLLALLPALLVLGGALHYYVDSRLFGLCIGLGLEALVATRAVKGVPRFFMSLSGCISVALMGWAALAFVVKMWPMVGSQALLPLKLVPATLYEFFVR